jgi:subtilisin-like proprotein convertase family protein
MLRSLHALKSLTLLTALAAVPAPGVQAAFTTLCNNNGITIPDSGLGTPFPSEITVAGLGTVTSVTATITGLAHTWPDDIAISLTGPEDPVNDYVWLMVYAGGDYDISGVQLTFAGNVTDADGISKMLPNSEQIVTGTYVPTDWNASNPYTAPGMSVFTGTDPNGTWGLGVQDLSSRDEGSIGGWCLTIEHDAEEYSFTGFYPPVRNDDLNPVKAGSAVPIKFSLDGDQGLGILEEGYPQVQLVDCMSGDPEGGPLQAVTAGKSGLQYDPFTDTYTFVWKTQKDWAGMCAMFELGLNDGSSHEASFSFK